MKNAYPNYAPDSIFTKPVYDLNKWLGAMREIYTKVHFGGVTFKECFGTVTSNWNEVEKQDFSAWMQYYQSETQNKYKKAFANFYVNDNIPGYFLPNAPNAPPPVVPDASQPLVTVKSDVQEKVDKEERRKRVEDQRKKIIGRLHAAVKHLTSHDGQLLAGAEFEKLLSSLYEIIKQVQTVNKISLSNRLYYDLIIRQANKLAYDGYDESARFLTKFAQNTQGALPLGQNPPGVASALGDGVAGTLGNSTPSPNALAAPIPPALEEPKEKTPLDELLENLETAGLTDTNMSEDDEEDLDEVEVTLENELMVEAQMAPEVAPKPQLVPETPAASAPILNPTSVPSSIPQEELEVTLPEKEDEDVGAGQSSGIDTIIDTALSSITVKDVVRKIEDINAIFQNRTIARELSIIDLMLSTLGLSSYFNNLSEIIQKNHEASNYSISRLSDILTKLRGAMSDETITLTEEPTVITDPHIKAIQDKLENQKSKEQNRKQMRKQLQNNELEEQMQRQNEPAIELAPQVPQAPAQPPTEEIAQTPAKIV
jgi:hypothetical protein